MFIFSITFSFAFSIASEEVLDSSIIFVSFSFECVINIGRILFLIIILSVILLVLYFELILILLDKNTSENIVFFLPVSILS